MDMSFAAGAEGLQTPVPTLTDFDVSNVEIGQRIGGSKKRQFVRFYKKVVQEFHISLDKNGQPEKKKGVIQRKLQPVEYEMVKIVTPGDKNEVDDVAQEFHKREHYAAYRAYREGRTAPLGVSLDECDWISAQIVTELRLFNCHTREQLADASDLLCERIPNGFELREYAKQICLADRMNQNPELAQVRNELASKDEVIANLMLRLEALEKSGGKQGKEGK